MGGRHYYYRMHAGAECQRRDSGREQRRYRRRYCSADDAPVPHWLTGAEDDDGQAAVARAAALIDNMRRATSVRLPSAAGVVDDEIPLLRDADFVILT
jgi:hypothetical protein